MLDKAQENGVSIPRVPEFPFIVVIDPGEHTLQSPRIRVFERRARLVQRLTDVCGNLLKRGPASTLRDEELVFVRVFGVEFLLLEILALLLEPVRQTLQEKQTEDVILVVRRVDGAAKNVSG